MQSRQTDPVSGSTETLAIPGRLEVCVAVCEPNSDRFRCSAPKIAHQSQPAKFRFPDHESFGPNNGAPSDCRSRFRRRSNPADLRYRHCRKSFLRAQFGEREASAPATARPAA